MNNRFQYSITSLLGLIVVLFMVACSDDDPKDPEIELFSISGTATYPDGAADGAVVFMAASEVATTNFTWTAVASANGGYSFGNLEPGSYYIFASYNTENVNNGRIEGINFDAGEGYLVEIVDASLTQDIALSTIAQDVQFVVNTTLADDDPDKWNQDYSHSNIDFRFPYDNANATYTGRFNSFAIDAVFDANDLANSSITASIDLLSVNTSSPGGRDSFWDVANDVWDYGCLAGTFGVAIDETSMLPDEATRYATFESSSIEAFGDGFKATGDFTFNGETNTETLFFRFINGFEAESRSGVLTRFSSFDGQIEFAALNDYGVESSHLLDAYVTVDVSFQVTHPVE